MLTALPFRVAIVEGCSPIGGIVVGVNDWDRARATVRRLASGESLPLAEAAGTGPHLAIEAGGIVPEGLAVVSLHWRCVVYWRIGGAVVWRMLHRMRGGRRGALKARMKPLHLRRRGLVALSLRRTHISVLRRDCRHWRMMKILPLIGVHLHCRPWHVEILPLHARKLLGRARRESQLLMHVVPEVRRGVRLVPVAMAHLYPLSLRILAIRYHACARVWASRLVL